MTSLFWLLMFWFLMFTTSAPVPDAVSFKHVCFNPIPVVPHNGTGCGVPSFVNISEHGANDFSKGFLRASPRKNSFHIKIVLRNLSRSDHVITAWLIHILPSVPKPDVFKYASIATPLSATTAAFTTGMGREPNGFKYRDSTTAVLKVKLDYNPTFVGESPVSSLVFNYQRDIPGIQTSEFRQYNQSASGAYVPTTSHFLRKYDPRTGYEILDKDGLPVIVRSPTKPFGIAIVNHLDRTTHGISQGILGADHYDLLGFSLQDKTIGKPIFTR